jgi:hypothetical protein
MLLFTAGAIGFFAAAILARHNELGPLLALLAIGLCGATSGYVLDEEAVEVADATPTSRPHRTTWRIAITLLPVAVATTALIEVDALAPDVHALRLLPVALGSIAIGIGLAAAMRRSGTAAPGDLAGVLTFATVVVAVLADPLGRWLSLRPLEAATYPVRSGLAWAAVILMAAVTLAASERDPGGGRRDDAPGANHR